MWLTSVKLSSRLMSLCATAPSTPTTMVIVATVRSSGFSSGPGNSSVSVRMMA